MEGGKSEGSGIKKFGDGRISTCKVGLKYGIIHNQSFVEGLFRWRHFNI